MKSRRARVVSLIVKAWVMLGVFMSLLLGTVYFWERFVHFYGGAPIGEIALPLVSLSVLYACGVV